MAKNILNLKFLVILFTIAALAGCSKKDEIQALKEQLAEKQQEADHWKRKYDAQSEDLKNAWAEQRNLDTRLSNFKEDALSTTQEVQQQYTNQLEYIAYLESEIAARDTTIKSQQDMINKQEADIQDFMDMLGIPAEQQAQANY